MKRKRKTMKMDNIKIVQNENPNKAHFFHSSAMHCTKNNAFNYHNLRVNHDSKNVMQPNNNLFYEHIKNVNNFSSSNEFNSETVSLSSDDFELMLEEAQIKEQIKRNVRMSSFSDEYIQSLVKGINSNSLDFEEQEKFVEKAIRANRRLANYFLTLETLLVKELDKIKQEFDNLKCSSSKPLEVNDLMVSRGFYSQFGAPYFKDASGFQCPRNQDFHDKLSKNQFIGYLHMQADHTADIAQLSIEIRKYIIEDFTKKSKLQDLKNKIKKVEDIKAHNILTKEISSINKTINLMKTVDLKYLVKGIPDSEIDWMKISSKDSLDMLSPSECLGYWNLILSPEVNRGPWSQIERKELKKIATNYNYHNWDAIAKLLNTNRTGYQCFIQFKNHFGMVEFNRGRWTKKEDLQLSYLVSISEQGGVISWGKVLYHLEDRTMAQALNRWYRLDPGLKKGKFTDEEDIILVNAVEQFGLDFQKVASVFPKRSAIQLRERYFAKQDMKVNKCGEWSLAEDKLLMELIAVHGERKWSKIAQNFPSRNRIQIRHRYKCIKLNFQKDPEFKLENLNRFKRNTHVNAKNKRDDDAISKSTAIDIISKTIEDGKIFYNKRRILKRTGKLKD